MPLRFRYIENENLSFWFLKNDSLKVKIAAFLCRQIC